jgi:nucleotide-binding universal stress UspA family protein
MAPIPLSRITVAVDGSPFADQALALAIDLAKRYDASLTVVAVAPMVPPYVSSTEPWMPMEVPEGELRYYRNVVDRAIADARGRGIAAASGVCLEGHVVDEIVAFLEKNPTDLLVIGSRGTSTAKRLLLGSTSDAVSHHVTCPVLIVRSPAKAPKEPPAAPPPA